MPIEKGYILLSRALLDSEISIKPPHFREIWVWLLIEANHAPRRLQGKMIERGQVLTSYNEIIQALKWEVGGRAESYTRNDIQCAFRYLKKANMITTLKSIHKTIVTVCKYDYYQTPNNYEIHTEIHTEIQSKSTPSPHYKQELKNERIKEKKSVSKNDTHTHTFSLFDVEECFKKWESEIGKKAKPGAPQIFFANQEKNGWKYNGKPITLDSHVKAWILEDSVKMDSMNHKDTCKTKSKLAI